MREQAPFQPADLVELDQALLARADHVVAMQEIHAGNHNPRVIGMRHDVDNDFAPAAVLARWEAQRGYRSTYYILHTAAYWNDEPFLRAGLEEIAVLGHEIGIHTNAITMALMTGRDPDEILWEAIDRLHDWGFPVRGVTAHGDPLCHEAHYINDEQFVECARPKWGPPDRTLTYQGRTVKLDPAPLAEFGLVYEAIRLPKGHYLSDSGGVWNEPFARTARRFPYERQLHILWHPDWWHQALSPQHAAAAA